MVDLLDVIVRHSFDFDREPYRRAIEIKYVRTNRVLPPEA